MLKLYQEKMRINKSILLIFFIICTSCTKSKREITIDNLTGGAKKYWTIVMDYPIKKYVGVSFDISGAYDEFIISDSGFRTKRRLYSLPFWKLINDTTLSDGNGDTLRIEYLNESILVLNRMALKGKKIFVFLKSEDQQTKPESDTTAYGMDL